MVGLFILIAFVVLKLTHVIDWSWWWVLSPLWIGFVIEIILHAVGGIGLGVLGLINWFKNIRERKRTAHIEDTLEGIQEVIEIEHPSIKKTKRSRKRILFCVIGVVLFWFAMWQRGTSYEYYEFYEYTQHDLAADILLSLACFFAVFGSYLWAKEKGRSWKWGALGLIAPFGYIVLMKLKDKRVLEETDTSIQGETKPIVLLPPELGANTEQESRRKRTINFCPECGSEVSKDMVYCPNCGKKLKNSNS